MLTEVSFLQLLWQLLRGLLLIPCRYYEERYILSQTMAGIFIAIQVALSWSDLHTIYSSIIFGFTTSHHMLIIVQKVTLGSATLLFLIIKCLIIAHQGNAVKMMNYLNEYRGISRPINCKVYLSLISGTIFIFWLIYFTFTTMNERNETIYGLMQVFFTLNSQLPMMVMGLILRMSMNIVTFNLERVSQNLKLFMLKSPLHDVERNSNPECTDEVIGLQHIKRTIMKQRQYISLVYELLQGPILVVLLMLQITLVSNVWFIFNQVLAIDFIIMFIICITFAMSFILDSQTGYVNSVSLKSISIIDTPNSVQCIYSRHRRSL